MVTLRCLTRRVKVNHCLIQVHEVHSRYRLAHSLILHSSPAFRFNWLLQFASKGQIRGVTCVVLQAGGVLLVVHCHHCNACVDGLLCGLDQLTVRLHADIFS